MRVSVIVVALLLALGPLFAAPGSAEARDKDEKHQEL
jgi:hypothetical protein